MDPDITSQIPVAGFFTRYCGNPFSRPALFGTHFPGRKTQKHGVKIQREAGGIQTH